MIMPPACAVVAARTAARDDPDPDDMSGLDTTEVNRVTSS
jgi:hypothetical protein